MAKVETKKKLEVVRQQNPEDRQKALEIGRAHV